MDEEKVYAQTDQSAEENVYKQADHTCGNIEFKIEGLKDGYRFTVKGNEEKLKEQRRVAASFMNFTRQADRAGWWLPWPLRVLLRFWNRYNR